MNNATNKYDRDDAIADVVSDSIGIVNTAVVTGLSMAFPLGAPVFIACGLVVDMLTRFAVSMFKAGNEVNRINSEIPLLGWEKDEVYRSRFLDWFGTRKADYFDDMMDQKKANDIAVANRLKFLEDYQEQFLGVVFSSRTMYFDGGCKLTKRYCSLKNAWGCTTWGEDIWTVGYGCNMREHCGTGRWARTCVNDFTRVGAWGYDDWECKCTGEKTTEGVARNDSYVNFMTTQQVYLERTVPGEVKEGIFKCKPGSLSYQGVYVSQQSWSWEYLCENAIALLQPSDRRHDGQVMLYDLENGNDQVYVGTDPTPTMFRMGDEGHKIFEDGPGPGQFMIDSNCSKPLTGRISGNGGDDGIIVGDNCTKGYEVTVDFKRGHLSSACKNLNLDFNGIEEFTGREGQGDVVLVACSTRKVMPRGGNETLMDRVTIDNDPTCKYDLVVLARNYTQITSGATNGTVNVVVANPWKEVTMELDIHPREYFGLNLMFLQTASSHLENLRMEVNGSRMNVGLGSVNGSANVTFNMNGEKAISAFFTEQPKGSPYSVLLLNSENNGTAMFYQSLPKLEGNLTREGCKFLQNVFDVTGPGWNIIGRDAGDEFVLNVTDVGSIDGGDGVDTIKFHEDFNGSIFIDLGSEKFKNVEQVFGVAGVPLSINAHCDTTLIAGQGGREGDPDIIGVPGKRCENRTTKIVALGHTRLVMEPGNGDPGQNDTIQVVVKENDKGELGFDFGVGATRSPEVGIKRQGNCCLTSRLCQMKNAWGCTVWGGDRQTVACGCEWQKKCGPGGMLAVCDNTWRFEGMWSFIDYQCTCTNTTSKIPVITSEPELHATTAPLTNLFMAVILTHKNWTVSEAKLNQQNQTISVNLVGVKIKSNMSSSKNERMKFKLKADLASGERYLPAPFIQVSIGNSTEVAGMLLFDQTTGLPQVTYSLNGSDTSVPLTVQGFAGIDNEFRLTTTDKPVHATGGSANDAFFITATEKEGGAYFIDGHDGDDTLIIANGKNATLTAPYLVNLVNNELGYVSIPSKKRGSVKNIEHVIGREDAPDAIHASCDAKTINGRSGRGPGKKQDAILISEPKCNYTLMTAVGKFTDLRNTAKVGEFTYLVEDVVTSSLEITATKTSMHSLKLTFHPWEFITAVVFNDTNEVMGWKLSDGQQEKIQMFPMWRPSKTEDYNNPAFEFHPPDSSVFSDIRVTANGITTATHKVIGNDNPDLIKGIPVDLNMFLIDIDISPNSTQPKGEIYGCSDGARCSANQFWIQNLGSSLKVLDGGACDNGGCSNYLHFSDHKVHLSQRHLYIDLDLEHGSIRTNDGEDVISELKNIHELHGTRDISAYVTCNTTHVSNLEEIFVRAGNCPLDLVIGVESFTQVYFEDRPHHLKENQTVFNDSAVYYHFSRPMSFDPDGEFLEIVLHSHVYYLPFKLDSLSEINFAKDEHKLYYTLDGTEYFYHSMIATAGYGEQFYAQPTMKTDDGYRIQVGRDGSLLATMGNTSVDVSPDSVPELQEKANSLGVTLMLYTKNDFYYIGHSSTGRERNSLQNIAKCASHLAGGGTDNTIYEILHLDKDVYIYTGYSEDTMEAWNKTGNGTKQTIDLSDVVVPIRQTTGTKYVPKITSEGDNIVISMTGHQKVNPGRVIIVNGRLPWVAKRLQVLLSVAMMDFEPIEVESKRTKRSVGVTGDNEWSLKPRPVIIPVNYTVYSISPDELEDGHLIQLEKVEPMENSSNGNGTDNDEGSFKAVRNGPNLLITNIHSFDLDEGKSVRISDFYPSSSHEATNKLHNHGGISGVNVQVPGLHLIPNKTKLYNMTGEGKNLKAEPATVVDWSCSLQEMEDRLLEDMPDFPRRFRSAECQSDWVTPTLISCGIFVLLVAVIVGLVFVRKQKDIRGIEFGKVWESLGDWVRNISYYRQRNYEQL